MARTSSQKTITVPKSVFDSMAAAYQKWEEFTNEFGDFILSSDQKFLREMRDARRSHTQGKVYEFGKLKAKLGL